MGLLRSIKDGIRALRDKRARNDEIDEELESFLGESISEKIFAVTGLFLALIGLYSVMSYSVSQRTKEIGVRMALGAKASEVQRMVVRGGMRLALLAVALGLPMALAAARLTTSLLYGIKPWDIATFTLVPLLLFAVSLFACWIPSRRASRVDPMVALRVD